MCNLLFLAKIFLIRLLFNVENNTTTRSAESYDMTNIMAGIDLANQISRADIVRDDKGMTGEGVKIGVIEPGIPDTGISQLSSADITIYQETNTPSVHTTIVKSYLVATGSDGTYHGIVPDAKIYSYGIDGSTASFYEGVEWLISQGVNIINASMGANYYSSNIAVAFYDAQSVWIDHLAIEHDVHFVKSAGNHKSPEVNYGYDNAYRISSPGMAYNAITVGNFHTDGTDDIDSFTFSGSRSCYIEDSASTYGLRAEKPNLVASGLLKNAIYNMTYQTYSDDFGTSYSAPQVAGVIAQLCDYSSKLKTSQTQVAAILTASSARKVEAVGIGEKGDTFASFIRVENNPQVSNREGAGILDARWAWGVVVNHNHWSASVESDDFPYTHTVTIDAGKNTITRVAIFWLKRNTLTNHLNTSADSNTYPLPNLNLYVYAPDGTLLGTSTLTYANFEIVQFVPPETGEYRIVITGNPNNTTPIGISVW